MSDASHAHEDPVAQAQARYRQIYNNEPRWVVAAPGRVNLIGEHTDYNGGFVLPMAIERRTVLAAGPSSDRNITLHSSRMSEPATFELVDPLPKGEPTWTNYVRGVIAGAQQRGVKCDPFHAVVESSVPMGGALSSSAALELATATLIEAMTGHRFDPLDKVLMCQKAEHDYAGMPCGIMDQYISAKGQPGHALLIDCMSNEAKQVPLDDPDIAVLIANTNVKHELTGSEYPTRRKQCETAAAAMGKSLLRKATMQDLLAVQESIDEVVFRRARHVITEDERTVAAAAAMGKRDWARVGQLMYESHRSMRDDFEISCSELDVMVELAEAIGDKGGVFGSRMTGGGFGGCTVSLVKADQAQAISDRMAAEYQQRTGIEPTLFVSRPAGGATIVTAASGEASGAGSEAASD
ncbi:galactokinase [Planctomycetales bacterium ZRK34]|nr:galactokinase [Planctomycetales bacterium ZRK34]